MLYRRTVILPFQTGRHFCRLDVSKTREYRLHPMSDGPLLHTLDYDFSHTCSPFTLRHFQVPALVGSAHRRAGRTPRSLSLAASGKIAAEVVTGNRSDSNVRATAALLRNVVGDARVPAGIRDVCGNTNGYPWVWFLLSPQVTVYLRVICYGYCRS